ncbi:MAG: hypothetical protein ACE5IR_13070 [bacterium]
MEFNAFRDENDVIHVPHVNCPRCGERSGSAELLPKGLFPPYSEHEVYCKNQSCRSKILVQAWTSASENGDIPISKEDARGVRINLFTHPVGYTGPTSTFLSITKKN